jgi:bifunctional non-homologous end joining protein LigD
MTAGSDVREKLKRSQVRRTLLPPLPRHFHAQLATLVKAPPVGDEWVHEIKLDGYRIGCRKDGDRITLLSRNGNDWTARFPEIAEAARKIRGERALLDGEVVMLQADGRTSFQALQNAFSGSSRAGLVYFVFDLLHLDGEDLARQPLETRKRALARIVGAASAGRKARDDGRIRYCEHVEGDGAAVLDGACRLHLEGIVSKRRDLPYVPGRHGGWLKTKCTARQELVIGGFTDPEGSRAGIGALLVGAYDRKGRLAFAGKVGTGFTQKSAVALRGRLNRLEMPTSPFDPPPAGWLGKHAHWVRPQLVAEVAFTEWTGEGKIRHPSFQGLRADKAARDVIFERPESAPGGASGTRSARRHAPSSDPPDQQATTSPRRRSARSSSGRVDVAGVSISHPDRVMYPDHGITKLDLARYYESIADWIVPHVAGRPLTLVRCPTGMRGECFYMKHSKLWAPPALRRVRIREKTKIGEYLIADSLAAVVSLVQMDVLEIHTWNANFDDVERPNRIVMDIDPGGGVRWASVVAAAKLVRSVLNTLGLESFVKTTGGAGLHVVVPLTPSADWSECLAFSRAVAEGIERQHPDLYTTKFAKAGREHKMLIDYLRNNRTNTSIAAFSARAKPVPTVSAPIAWDELSARLRPDSFTVKTVPRRLARMRRDPWKNYRTIRQTITAAAMKTVRDL